MEPATKNILLENQPCPDPKGWLIFSDFHPLELGLKVAEIEEVDFSE